MSHDRHPATHLPSTMLPFCRAALVIAAAAAFLAPTPQHTSVLRAEPRWVDGPADIGEAGAMSRHTGGAVCVLYFSPMAEGGAAALATVEFAGQALPSCEFLLASKDKDDGCWGAFDALGPDRALPCVEVFDGGTSQGVVPAGDLIATLAGLGYTPSGPGASSTQGSVDGDRFFNLADDLWWRSKADRDAPRPKTPAPTNRRQEQRSPRTTASFIPGSGMGQAPPPGMRDEIKRQQDLEKQLGGALPPGGRIVEGGDTKPPPKKKPSGPDPIEEMKKNVDAMMRGLGKDTEAVRKQLGTQAREAQVLSQKAADDAVRAAGGETKRDKLEKLFASDAEEVPTDENLSEFERFLENRRTGGTDADFNAAPKAEDDDWLGGIKYKPPPK